MRRRVPSPVRPRIVVEAVAQPETLRLARRRPATCPGQPRCRRHGRGVEPGNSSLKLGGKEGDPMAGEAKRVASAAGLRVPFGERDGVLYSPAAVDGGLACGCRCPGCGRALLAKKGS